MGCPGFSVVVLASVFPSARRLIIVRRVLLLLGIWWFQKTSNSPLTRKIKRSNGKIRSARIPKKGPHACKLPDHHGTRCFVWKTQQTCAHFGASTRQVQSRSPQDDKTLPATTPAKRKQSLALKLHLGLENLKPKPQTPNRQVLHLSSFSLRIGLKRAVEGRRRCIL